MARVRSCRHGESLLVVTFWIMSAAACSAQAPTAVGEGGWLAGTTDEKFATVAAQLRGFDMAMVETGYRYNELYWAVRDGNFGYAAYQARKIRTAIENGLKRRPKRAKSAETFLTVVLPSVEDAIKQRNATLLQKRFGSLTATCNSCHKDELVEFVRVAEPQVRMSGAPK